MATIGWLFDVYPLGDRVVLWFITPEGEKLRLEDDFPYVIYLAGAKARLQQAAEILLRRGWVKRVYPARGQDLQSGKEIPVLALELKGYAYLSPLRAWLGGGELSGRGKPPEQEVHRQDACATKLGGSPGAIAAGEQPSAAVLHSPPESRTPNPESRSFQGGLEYYNCDLDVAAYYLYRRRLHPCAWYDLEIEGSRLKALAPREDPFALEFSLPPLTTLYLGLAKDPLIPLTAGNCLVVGWEGQTLELEAGDARSLVSEVARYLSRLNPDVVLSDWGDEDIIPTLWRLSRQERLVLPLDRESANMPQISRRLEACAAGRSYFSYGKIVYQGPSVPFYGRWHVDRRNSFFFREGGLPGLVQISRLGQMPLQQAARTSPGTLITSMQLARATADHVLIPWRKGEPERFKTAGELLTIDKGGLSFMPPVGLHFEVAELDFASMYPTIMTIHNISPETVNCACCADRFSVFGFQFSVDAGQHAPQKTENRKQKTQNLVPEAGFRLCQRREGLVPRTLGPILQLRERLKARAREVPPERAGEYQARQNALKWMLVTCFGYLGYKNARFGRIEAHEAVTAFGRDKLLTAKEMCEAAGFKVLHGLTDCLWIQKAGVTEAELTALCGEIGAATGVKLDIEGMYKWIVFMASRQNPKRPVATRYFGAFSDGRLKVRGLACRRRDTPPFVRRAQEALLTRLTAAATAADLAAIKPELEEMAEHYRQLLREGGITPQELVVTRVLSQPLADFRVDTATALAVRQLERAGVHLVPGEKVRFVHRERNGPKELRVQAAPFLEGLEDYDTGVYLELLDRSVEEVLEGVFGIGEQGYSQS